MNEPVGAKEIAERCGVQRDTVKKWQERYEDFPEGVQLSMGKVWQWEEIAIWCGTHGRPNRIERLAAEKGISEDQEIAEFKAKRADRGQ